MDAFKLFTGSTLVFTLALTGCNKSTGFSSGAGSGNSTLASSPTQVVATQDPMSCLVTTPNFSLAASIDSFELTGGANANAGFNINSILSAIGLNVTYSTGQLNMSMTLQTPLYGPARVAIATGNASSNNFSFSASVLDGLIGGGLGFWSSTGLQPLSVSALGNTFTALSKNIPGTVWSTVVTGTIAANQYTIPVGETTGLQMGDTFNVYSVSYVWGGNGAPCTNPLQIVNKLNGGAPIGVATVKQIAYDTAIVEIDGPSLPVVNYDRLEILKLAPAANGSARTQLKYSMHISGVTQAADLQFNNGTSIETVPMTGFVGTDLTNYLVNTVGYYNVQ